MLSGSIKLHMLVATKKYLLKNVEDFLKVLRSDVYLLHTDIKSTLVVPVLQRHAVWIVPSLLSI